MRVEPWINRFLAGVLVAVYYIQPASSLLGFEILGSVVKLKGIEEV